MKETTFVKALEAEAIEQLSLIREYRNYEGNNPDYKNRAKAALGVIGAYVRLRATMANEHSNELIAQRMLGGYGSLPESVQKKLSAGN